MAAPSGELKVVSEDELGVKWDRCLADTAIKTAAGLGLGVVFSFVIFKRKTWPIAFGVGSGLGMGFTNCQHELKNQYSSFGRLIKKDSL